MWLKQSLKTLVHVCGLFVIMLLIACGQEKAQMVTLTGKTMGTTYTVKYIVPSQHTALPAAQAVQAQMDKLLQDINQQMSTYQADSEISRFNQLPHAGDTMAISADFANVLTEAMRLNQITQGALDITVGPLVNIWGFGPDKQVLNQPTAAQLKQLESVLGMDKIQLNTQQRPAQLRKQVAGVYIDLSAIAKGFGVDKLANYLDSLGVQDYLVEIGGELRGKGNNLQGMPWRVGIEQPQMAQGQATQIVVPLNQQALATSGDYRHFRVDEQGRRLSHIIHPHTMQPINHQLASVSVLADSAMMADGLATGLFVLGEEQALAVAEQQQLAVFLIVKTEQGYTTKMSSAFQKIVNQ